MTEQEFEDTLRQFIRREPFEPFIVELNDGTSIDVFTPAIVFDAGAATYISPNDDFIDFVCENVKALRRAVLKAVP